MDKTDKKAIRRELQDFFQRMEQKRVHPLRKRPLTDANYIYRIEYTKKGIKIWTIH